MAAGWSTETAIAQIWRILDDVMDPEVPVISVVDLGIVRDVRCSKDGLEVVITPTYSGCPATAQIKADIRAALDAGGFGDAGIVTQLSPPWTTAWISGKGREALGDFGIAPPQDGAAKEALFGSHDPVQCPHCSSRDTVMVSEFGSTACKALWKCRACGEPFDYFKCL